MPDSLKLIDRLTMYGLTAVGLCLMLGLFTPSRRARRGRLSSLNIYLSISAVAGPARSRHGGHYRYVN